MKECREMNYEQLTKLMNGEPVKVGNKNNQIYYDKDNNAFIVEMYEFTSDREGEMFSVADSFENIEIAITAATKYTGETYNYEIQKRLLKQFA
jgi:beta-N-acetylglucosaminidase